MFPVADKTANILVSLIKELWFTGDTIISDHRTAYQNKSGSESFTHFSVNHSLNFITPIDSNIHT